MSFQFHWSDQIKPDKKRSVLSSCLHSIRRSSTDIRTGSVCLIFNNSDSLRQFRQLDVVCITFDKTSVQRRLAVINFFSDEVPLCFVLVFCDELLSSFAGSVLVRVSASKLSSRSRTRPPCTRCYSRVLEYYHHKI